MNETVLLSIAKKHLQLITKYDPYRNFPGVEDREGFRNLLARDPAFKHLGLADERYVIARLGGNWVTSLHRKIGDMYEGLFQYLLQAQFGLSEDDLNFGVDVQIGDRRQRRSTDGVVRIQHLKQKRVDIGALLSDLSADWGLSKGLGFEVRSCYQIGDSKRIQADYDMALALEAEGFVPVMLVFCATSLRSPVTRLRKSWNLLEGDAAFDFVRRFVGFDLQQFLAKHSDAFKSEIHKVLAKF